MKKNQQHNIRLLFLFAFFLISAFFLIVMVIAKNREENTSDSLINQGEFVVPKWLDVDLKLNKKSNNSISLYLKAGANCPSAKLEAVEKFTPETLIVTVFGYQETEPFGPNTRCIGEAFKEIPLSSEWLTTNHQKQITISLDNKNNTFTITRLPHSVILTGMNFVNAHLYTYADHFPKSGNNSLAILVPPTDIAVLYCVRCGNGKVRADLVKFAKNHNLIPADEIYPDVINDNSYFFETNVLVAVRNQKMPAKGENRLIGTIELGNGKTGEVFVRALWDEEY